MPGLPVPWGRIDKERKDSLLDWGYNDNVPAKGSPERAKFYAERVGVFEAVESSVGKHWEYGIGEGDFFMGGQHVADPLMCIEVGSETMIDVRLLQIVHAVISKFERDYVVDVCDAWGFLKTADGKKYPHFNIFVEKKRILIYSESELVLKKLGLSDESSSEK